MAESTVNSRESFSRNLETFAVHVYSELLQGKPNQNIVFSPLSIQTCAAMARLGAEGETAKELDRGLKLSSSDLTEISDTFYSILAKYEKSNILKIANKIYVMKNYAVQDEFNQILSKKFFSTAEEINFTQNEAAAGAINDWVKDKTNNLIKDLVPASALNEYTRLVLLNAIHFKGEWQHKFKKQDTREQDFYLNDVDKVKVQMMSTKERFRYAEVPELDAVALEMAYKDSDLSMLVLLPNKRTGLKDLEQKLKTVSLQDITSKMFLTQVIVKFPRFKAEFEVELKDTFEKMGMTRMFSDEAEFGKMLKTPESLKVSKIIHKAFIDVNEEGTEAAAATGIVIRMKRSLISFNEPPEFIADHPFLYVINDQASTTKTAVVGDDTNAIEQQFSPISLFWGTVATDNFVKSPHAHNEL